jgi:hypothetical protein
MKRLNGVGRGNPAIGTPKSNRLLRGIAMDSNLTRPICAEIEKAIRKLGGNPKTVNLNNSLGGQSYSGIS